MTQKSPAQDIASIPIRVESAPNGKRLHVWRRFSQYVMLLVLVLIPVSGMFRIDPLVGAFRIFDYQIWFSDIAIVMGFWLMVASLLVITYSFSGAVFCGWLCPQNTVSEWANHLTTRLLGRNARFMDMSGEKMRVASRKRSPLNMAILIILVLLASMLYALIPLLYFFPPESLWNFMTLKGDELSDVLLWIYLVCVLVMFVDIAVLRHLVCKYMCIYRIWQHSFKTRDTLHIVYDKSRADECVNCNYCRDSCFIDIDPRQTEVFDSCINCGACITACDELHQKSKKLQGGSLLRFEFGNHATRKGVRWLGSFFARAKVTSIVVVMGGFLFVVGVLGYSPYALTVDKAELIAGTTALDYRVNIANKVYRPADFTIRVEGLDAGDYVLDHQSMHFETAGRQDVLMHLSPSIAKGLHRFTVHVSGDHGWKSSFTVHYYAQGGQS